MPCLQFVSSSSSASSDHVTRFHVLRVKEQTGRNNNPNTTWLRSHARQSDAAAPSADTGNETCLLGKGSPKPLLSSLLSACYCLHLTARQNAASLLQLCNIPRNGFACVKKRTNVIWLVLFRKRADLISWFLNSYRPCWRRGGCFEGFSSRWCLCHTCPYLMKMLSIFQILTSFHRFHRSRSVWMWCAKYVDTATGAETNRSTSISHSL